MCKDVDMLSILNFSEKNLLYLIGHQSLLQIYYHSFYHKLLDIAMKVYLLLMPKDESQYEKQIEWEFALQLALAKNCG